MSVETILKTKGSTVYSVRPEHAVSDAAALMSAKKVGVALVCDGKGRLHGVISERDIVIGITQFGKGLLDMPVRNIMTSPVVTCTPADTAKGILEVMTKRRIRHLPVVDGDDILGIVSIGDAVNYRLNEAEMEKAVLRDFAVAR